MSKLKQLSQVEHIVWHPVESVMPNDERVVLIKTDSPVLPAFTGYCFNKSTWLSIGSHSISGNVTHWAELPEGPKS